MPVDDDPEAWMAHAACRGMPIEWWFPNHGERPVGAAVCDECPVIADCWELALSLPDEYPGMFAGMSQRDRILGRRERRGKTAMAARVSEPIPHGTDRGYRRHLRAGTPACASCKAAHAAVEAHQAATTAEKYRTRRTLGWCAQCSSGRHSLHAATAPCCCEECA